LITKSVELKGLRKQVYPWNIWTGRREQVDFEEPESPKKAAKWWSRIYSVVIGYTGSRI
jgi:hypothetical protein